MWSKPTKADLERLARVWGSGEKATRLEDILIRGHFFLGGNDWFVSEYDPTDRVFFGYAVLNGNLDFAEWGYVSFDELLSINYRGFEVDWDRHWKTQPFEQVMREYKRRRGL